MGEVVSENPKLEPAARKLSTWLATDGFNTDEGGIPVASEFPFVVVDVVLDVNLQELRELIVKDGKGELGIFCDQEKPIPQEINPLSSFEFDEFSSNDFDDQELCKLLSECEQRLNDSKNDEMEKMLNTNENNTNEDCVPRNKQDVTQFDNSGCVTQPKALDLNQSDGGAKIYFRDLSYNQIEELPPGVFDNNPELTILYLYRNQIAQLPPGVFSYNTKLIRLDLDDNQIKELPPGVFANNTELTVLDLSDNQIEELPPGVFDNNPELTILYPAQTL
ncbi:Carboxypeptidase N subunit 2 [Stylophora pistillata]|uniref:Carboxypeptidase N subunit 2 n=1 Tax=Stylophora pistillata TaxID=50429 RepID=A0A2B4R9J2_STYPI|nr:Carboxypeptidase N subunit 2 [Stylophora pistillata]